MPKNHQVRQAFRLNQPSDNSSDINNFNMTAYLSGIVISTFITISLVFFFIPKCFATRVNRLMEITDSMADEKAGSAKKIKENDVAAANALQIYLIDAEAQLETIQPTLDIKLKANFLKTIDIQEQHDTAKQLLDAKTIELRPQLNKLNEVRRQRICELRDKYTKIECDTREKFDDALKYRYQINEQEQIAIKKAIGAQN